MPLVEAAPDTLARTYAQSLYELAHEKGGEDMVQETLAELEAVLELARADARFSEFLASRVLAVSDRKRSLQQILGERASELTLHFLLVLNDKGRLDQLPAVVAAYDEAVQAAFGKIEVDIYTAGPLSGEDLAATRERLHQALGREPVLHHYVDGSMIGGVKLQVGDKLIDASIATKLRQLKDKMATHGVNEIRGAAGRLLDDSE